MHIDRRDRSRRRAWRSGRTSGFRSRTRWSPTTTRATRCSADVITIDFINEAVCRRVRGPAVELTLDSAKALSEPRWRKPSPRPRSKRPSGREGIERRRQLTTWRLRPHHSLRHRSDLALTPSGHKERDLAGRPCLIFGVRWKRRDG